MLLTIQSLGQGCDLLMCLWALTEPRSQAAPAHLRAPWAGIYAASHFPPYCLGGRPHKVVSVHGLSQGVPASMELGRDSTCLYVPYMRFSTLMRLKGHPIGSVGWGTASGRLLAPRSPSLEQDRCNALSYFLNRGVTGLQAPRVVQSPDWAAPETQCVPALSGGLGVNKRGAEGCLVNVGSAQECCQIKVQGSFRHCQSGRLWL